MIIAILLSSWTTGSHWLHQNTAVQPVSATNGALTISATANPNAGKIPLNVTFKGSVSGGTPPYAVLWDFDDGEISNTLETYHVYRFPENFTVQFWAQDSSTPPTKQSTTLTVSAHGTGNLHVTITDQTGNPINGATVRILNAPPGQDKFSTPTNSSGIANLGTVSAGIYTIQAYAQGRKNATGTVSVPHGSTTALALVLSPEEGSTGQTLLNIFAYTAGAVVVIAAVLYFAVRWKKTGQARAETAGKPRGTSRPGPPRTRKQQENLSLETERTPET